MTTSAVRRCAAAAAVAGCTLFATSEARAEPRTKIADICTGCFASAPSPSDGKPPPPLLVTLHGDWGVMARELHAAWERFAAPRGVALLSLTCPVDRGCKKSWWQWNGSPRWIAEQIDRLAARLPVDRERMWIAGWSGGSAYIGMHSQEFEGMFAGLVLHGGGIWPSRAGCAPEKAAAIFLAGDQNPLHPHVLELRKHYEACGNEVSFILLRGADHDAEWKALDKRGGEILDWLSTKRRVALAAPAASTVQADLPPPGGPPVSPSPRVSAPSPSPPEPVRPRAGCGCELMSAPAPARAGWGLAIMLVVFAAVRSGRRR